MKRADIIAAIEAERDRQDQMWGTSFPGRPLERWVTILTEEVGEVAKAVLDENMDDWRRELVQVAAVAVKILEYTGGDGE